MPDKTVRDDTACELLRIDNEGKLSGAEGGLAHLRIDKTFPKGV